MNKNAVVVILLTLFLVCSHSVYAQFAVSPESIDGDTSTATLLENIGKFVSDTIDSAENSGNYLLFKSATELKSITEAWKKANIDLSDKAYKTINKSQQEFIEGAHTAAKKIEQNNDAQQQVPAIIAKLENQAITDGTILHGKPAIFSYMPRVLYPGMERSVSFTIRGINFKKASPRIELPNRKFARRISLSNQEAVFSIPLSAFQFDRSKAKLANLKFSYLRTKKKRERTDISLLLLPETLGSFSLQIKTRDNVHDIWEGSRQFYWAGLTESKTLSQGPHDKGWRIMPSSLRQGRVWGTAGKGCSIASNEERGFAIEVRLDVTKKDLKATESPNQYCEWHWKETFDRQVINPQEPINGNISWSKNIRLPLPINTASILLQVTMWNGAEYTINGPQSEPFFDVIELDDILEIKSKLPGDLNTF